MKTALLFLSIFFGLSLNAEVSNTIVSSDIKHETEYPGCTDSYACNYDPDATIDDYSCVFADEANCLYCINGQIVNGDSDGDGCCDDSDAVDCADYDAVNYNPCAAGNGGEYDYLCIYAGCTDPTACNFDPDNTSGVEDCCYEGCGCKHPFATNYEPSSSCASPICVFALEGIVFFDENQNGVRNLPQDYLLSNQQVLIQPGNIIAITNDEGSFSAPNLLAGNYTITIQTNAQFPASTTAATLTRNPASPFSFSKFGLSSTALEYELNVYTSGGFNASSCDQDLQFFVNVLNRSSTVLSGNIEVEVDPLYQYFVETPQNSTQNGNTLVINYGALLPGQRKSILYRLQTPTAEFVGEELNIVASATGFYEGEETAYGAYEMIRVHSCNNLSNSAQAFPNGYTDQNFIVQDQELEYLINFQNIGTSDVEDILVTTQIDPNLDLSSFALNANSHSMNTAINFDTRLVTFSFADLSLPPSSESGSESQGFVSFYISPNSDVQPNIVISNSSTIYLGEQPPINIAPTLNTTYSCAPTSVDENDGSVGCPGDFDYDGKVGIDDLLNTISNIGIEGLCVPDISGDFKVDIQDLLFVTSHLGTFCL